MNACIFPFFAQIGDPTEIKVGSSLGDGVVFGSMEIDLSDAKMRESMDVVLGGKDREAAPCDDQFEGLLEAQGPTDLLDQGPTAECFVVALGEDREFAVDVLGGAAAIAVAGGGVGFVFAQASELLCEEQKGDAKALPQGDEGTESAGRERFAERSEGILEEGDGLFGVVAVALCAGDLVEESDTALVVFDDHQGVAVDLSGFVIIALPKVAVTIKDGLMEGLGAFDRVVLSFAEFVESGEKVGFTGSRQRFGTMGVEEQAGGMFLLAGFAIANMR